MRRRWWVWGIAVVLVLVSASTALAEAIPGATYNGVAADGASVALTVSSDGTLVDSYYLTGVTGHEPNGATCQFTGEGVNGQWEGAPIVDNSFQYHLYDAIVFQGTFSGAQSASGTFRFYDAATNQTQACDSGTVSWTATTATPPPGAGGGGGAGSGGEGGGGSQGGGGSGHGHKPGFLTRVTFRKTSIELLRGQISSPNGACRVGRKVVLWRGKRRMATTESKAGGKFSFRRTASIRGSFVRASTPVRNVKAGACAAASSTFIKG
jgi:hypothetical protein